MTAVSDNGYCRLEIGFRQKTGEFFTSGAPGDTHFSKMFLQHTGDSLQYLVACRVAVGVVDPFEPVDVRHHNDKGLFSAHAAVKFFFREGIAIGMVVQSCERICLGQMPEMAAFPSCFPP